MKFNRNLCKIIHSNDVGQQGREKPASADCTITAGKELEVRVNDRLQRHQQPGSVALTKKNDFRNNKAGNCYPNSSPRYKLDQPNLKGVAGTPAPIPREVGLEGKVFKFMIDDINSIRQTSQAQFLCSRNAHSLEFPFPFYFFMRML